jgi:polysaccharide export outer membrane protein
METMRDRNLRPTRFGIEAGPSARRRCGGSLLAIALAAHLAAAESKVDTNAFKFDRGAGAQTNQVAFDPPSDDRHALAAGDRVSLRIVEDKDPARPLVVSDSGELEIPYLGRFAVAGKTCRDAALAIEARLEATYYHQATVQLALDQFNRSRGRVYLAGYVRVPGPQEIPTDETFTLSKAIARAGGFAEFADKKRVKVLRERGEGGSDKPLVVNVGEVWDKGAKDKDFVLAPGDFVLIEARGVNF